MGRVYKRGRIWWIQYYRRGRVFRETSRSPLKSVASALLKKREGDIARGWLPDLRADRTTYEDLVRLHLQDLQINGQDPSRARYALNHLNRSFAGLVAAEITSERLKTYIVKRQSEGAANGTINRELRALGRMFRLATQQTPPLVLYCPSIPHLREDNVRKGFFTEDEYRALYAALPDYLKVPLVIGYWTGMRAGEILALHWDQVDLTEGRIRLEPGTTKNGHGRTIPLVDEAVGTLRQWNEHTRLCHPACPWVCHYYGRRLQKIPKRMWRRTCDRIGLDGRLFHDLRRTAVRNMVRAGISERVAMEISGHRTRSIFNRYDIVNEVDLSNAVVQLQNSTRPNQLGRNRFKNSQEEN
jgi:integrase